MGNTNTEESVFRPCLFVSLNYLIHTIVHFLAINYLTLYILFLDAEENISFMVPEAKTWNSYNIMNMFIVFYIIMFSHAFLFSVKYTRHMLPIVAATAFYGIAYICIIIGVTKNQGCKQRTLLTCYGDIRDTYITNTSSTFNNSYNNETITTYNVTTQNITNESLSTSESYMQYALLIIFGLICIYTAVISIAENRMKSHGKYYASKNIVYEFLYLIWTYFVYGLLIVFIPFICFANSTPNSAQTNQIALGNFVNGNQIHPIIYNTQNV